MQINPNEAEREGTMARTKSEKLMDIIKSKGITVTWLAKRLGISREGLYLKIKNDSQFRQQEIFTLCNELGLSLTEMQDIFFTDEVD